MLEHKYLKRSCCYGAWLAVLILSLYRVSLLDGLIGPVLTGEQIYRQKCAVMSWSLGRRHRRALSTSADR